MCYYDSRKKLRRLTNGRHGRDDEEFDNNQEEDEEENYEFSLLSSSQSQPRTAGSSATRNKLDLTRESTQLSSHLRIPIQYDGNKSTRCDAGLETNSSLTISTISDPKCQSNSSSYNLPECRDPSDKENHDKLHETIKLIYIRDGPELLASGDDIFAREVNRLWHIIFKTPIAENVPREIISQVSHLFFSI